MEDDQWMGDVRMVHGHTVLKSGMGVQAMEWVEHPRGVLRSMWTHAEGQGEVLGGAWVRVEMPQENTEKHVDTRRTSREDTRKHVDTCRIAGRSTRRCTGAGGNTPGEY